MLRPLDFTKALIFPPAFLGIFLNLDCKFYNSKDVIEFSNKNILFTSSFSNRIIDTKFLNYVNPNNRAEAKKRHDWNKWEEAENVEINAFISMKYMTD